jgi:hypothetical protein
MTDLAVHDGPIFAFTMTDLAVHDGPIFAFTMVRNSHFVRRAPMCYEIQGASPVVSVSVSFCFVADPILNSLPPPP